MGIESIMETSLQIESEAERAEIYVLLVSKNKQNPEGQISSSTQIKSCFRTFEFVSLASKK